MGEKTDFIVTPYFPALLMDVWGGGTYVRVCIYKHIYMCNGYVYVCI